jgi:hypothetical protein
LIVVFICSVFLVAGAARRSHYSRHLLDFSWMRRRRGMTSESVPVFKLYGETTLWPTPDLLHCESIP